MAEKKYIECEAAIKRFNFAVLDCLGMEPTIRAGDIIKALESIPAADVVPVVRCKDCKNYIERSGACAYLVVGMREDDFCSYGSKKEA